MNDAVMLSEAKHLWLFLFVDRPRFDPSFLRFAQNDIVR